MSEPKSSGLVYVGAAASLLSAVSVGCCLGFNSPALPSMIYNTSAGSAAKQYNHLVAHNDTHTISWIGSIMGIGALFGALLSGWLSQHLGRKLGLLVSTSGSALSWLLITNSASSAILIINRLLSGFFAGLISGIAPTYSAEIATKDIRGGLGACFQIGITIGVFSMSAFGFVFNWRHLALICCIFAILAIILLLFVPETPYFLLKSKPDQPDHALEHSLKLLRKPGSDLQQELNEILATVQTAHPLSFSTEMFKQKEFCVPLSQAILLMYFQQFSGINTIISYQEYTLKQLFSAHEHAAFYASVGATTGCFVQVLATILSSFLIDRFGRRLLLIISSCGHMIALIGFSVYLLMQMQIMYLPVIFLCLFLISFSIGWGPVPWIMIPELSSNEHRSAIACFGSAFNWTFAFLITKLFLLLELWISAPVIYLYFAFSCFLSIIYVMYFLPETTNKNLNTSQ